MAKGRTRFTLLDDETSDSEQEHFSMSSLGNNNKAKTKHNWSPKKKESTKCCNCQVCMLYVLSVTLAACIAVLAVYTYGIHIKLMKLENEVHGIEKKPPGNMQINAPQNLQQIAQKQLQLEKTVRNLNEASLGNIQLNISKLFTQISLLNSSVSSLSKQLSAENSPQLENKELMQNIATLGSTVHSLQTEVSQLTTLRDLMSSQKEKLQTIDVLVNEIDSLNQTFNEHYHDSVGSIQFLMNKTESLELRFNLIEAKPNLSVSPNAEAMIENAIHESLSDALKNVTLPATSLDNSTLKQLGELVHTVQDQVLEVNVTLSEKIQETSKVLEQTKAQVTVLRRSLATFKNLTDAELKQLKADLGQLSTRIEEESSTATDTKLAGTPSTENTKTTEAPSTSNMDVVP